MRFLRRSLVGLFLIGLTLGLLGLAGRSVYDAVQSRMNAEPRSFPVRERVVSVNVVPYLPETLTPALTVFGEVRAARSLVLRAATAGTVQTVADDFTDGGTVTQDETLVTLDPTDADTALARIEADLTDAEATAREADSALSLAEDELVAARAQADLRQQALTRQRDLQSRGIGTAPEREAAELAASAADQAVLTGRQAVADAQSAIDRAASALARSRIDLAEAQRARDDATIAAPFDGVLADVAIVPGTRVTANEAFATLIDPTALEVTFRLSTAQYATLTEAGGLIGAPVTVTLDASGIALTSTGRITRESGTVGAGQTGRLIFARLDAASGLRPGDFVTVAITEPALDGVARLPATAVAADGTLLTVGDDDRLSLAPATVLRRTGDDVIVRADGIDGLPVVTERTPLLGAGILVNPIAPDGAAPAETADATPALISLDPDRRARLIAFVQGNDAMPGDTRDRILAQLAEPEVPSDVVARLEERMGS